MTAVRYDDVGPVPLAPAPRQAAKPRRQPSMGSGNALMDMTTHVLTATLRQLYAALWRAGVIEVTA
ncbi:Rv1535 family protein [Mycobacterium sp. 852002-10029_SCH5224772]|uniref:Rv1535 family protein n=1 Tax=Mycobacterium sp. 852002-10029_SCH5224772 TaxID=1834083 RepID=UPI0007FC1A9D|nr:Rv1535 family protein [Mycobacterium sp. 852002-10029_SCH5224772]OBF05548.1 hypothetical protein A5775_22745 [Mycobacterium sp. 852002-10029_SCH5224772]